MKRNRFTKDYKAKVALEAVKGQKTINELASEFGVHVSQINNWKKQLLEALPGVFNGRQAQQEALQEAEKDRLYQQDREAAGGGRLAEKKSRTSDMSVDQKRQCIEPTHAELSINRQCDLIGLPRASYYRRNGCGLESEENLLLMRLIDEEYTRHPFYGSRKLRDYLRRQGYPVNRKRVRRLMKRMGLVSIAPKPNTSRPAPGHKVYPYLLKEIEINRVNQVWCRAISPIYRWNPVLSI
jgi:putative transposase